ncbi:MAG: hypothetical protein KC550_01185, partial [Nanoarchaeota archaeon]|nr:hypothetical protein [Nanoarchaeota archaeon]
MKQDIIEFLRNQSQSNREIIDEISGIIFQSLPNIKEKVVNDIEINVLIDETLYIKNPNQINITFQEIRINDIDCLGLNGTYSDVIKIFNVSSCIGNISDEILDILVITDKKIYQKKIYQKKDLEQLIFSSACSNFTYKNNVCLDNVVAYWPFNNTILDFSGNGLDVTLNSGATVSNAGLRTLGGSYATIPTVNISLENGLSYSLWLNTTSFGSSWARIVELGRGASGSD